MRSTTHEARRLIAIATPVIATQVGTMMLGVIDALMVGRVNRESLAAAALGNVWVIGVLIVSMGIVFGIDPLVSQAHGAGDGGRVGLAAQQGIAVALLISIPTALALLLTKTALVALGQDPLIAAQAHNYAIVQIPAVPAFLVFTALRQYLQGRAIVTPAMWIVLISNLVNVAFNWVLIFGHLGSPALGLVGSGIATSVTRIFLVAALAGWILLFRLHEGAWIPWSTEVLRPARLLEVLRYGTPVAAQIGFEVWAFQFAALLAGRFGAAALASHTIVLNLASLSFMFPLGISIAAATRVGNLIGAKDPNGAQRAAWVAMGLAGMMMAVFAITFVAFRQDLPALYVPGDTVVIELAALLLPIAATFQLFDGLQVVANGVLRGMGRTKPTVIFNLVAFYLLGLPLAWILSIRAGMGVRGIWWGLCLGLAAVAMMLVAWIAVRGPAKVDSRIV